MAVRAMQKSAAQDAFFLTPRVVTARSAVDDVVDDTSCLLRTSLGSFRVFRDLRRRSTLRLHAATCHQFSPQTPSQALHFVRLCFVPSRSVSAVPSRPVPFLLRRVASRRVASRRVASRPHRVAFRLRHVASRWARLAASVSIIYYYSCLYYVILQYIILFIYTSLSLYIYIYIYIHTLICVYTCIHTYVRACVRTYVRTYIHIYLLRSGLDVGSIASLLLQTEASLSTPRPCGGPGLLLYDCCYCYWYCCVLIVVISVIINIMIMISVSMFPVYHYH